MAKKALIIDDEMDICQLLAILLKQRNIQSLFAGSLAEGDLYADFASPDIIFLDNDLPDGMGISHIRKLKELYPLAKIIMITAQDTGYERENALKEGSDFFIGKPFTKETIYRALDGLIGKS